MSFHETETNNRVDEAARSLLFNIPYRRAHVSRPLRAALIPVLATHHEILFSATTIEAPGGGLIGSPGGQSSIINGSNPGGGRRGQDPTGAQLPTALQAAQCDGVLQQQLQSPLGLFVNRKDAWALAASPTLSPKRDGRGQSRVL